MTFVSSASQIPEAMKLRATNSAEWNSVALRILFEVAYRKLTTTDVNRTKIQEREVRPLGTPAAVAGKLISGVCGLSRTPTDPTSAAPEHQSSSDGHLLPTVVPLASRRSNYES